jgi:hypothetical protein
MPALKKPSKNGARSVSLGCLPSSVVTRQALASAPSVMMASFCCSAIWARFDLDDVVAALQERRPASLAQLER